jgi:Nif-specific regulatory protein
MTALSAYDWPGNIRELQNAIERAVVLGSSDTILLEDLPETIVEDRPPSPADALDYHNALTMKKRELITDALKATGGNYTEAARKLGIHPNYLHRLIRLLDLRTALHKNTA